MAAQTTVKPRPETPLDVQTYFYDVLKQIDEKTKPKDVEKYFEFIDWPDKLGARFKRYLPQGFNELMALVKEWGGEYDRDRRQFVIPKSTKKDVPTPAPPATKGYYATKPGYYPNFPIDNILSGKFSFRLGIQQGIEELMGEIHAAGRIIEPLICRPSHKPGYVEVGPGERRLLAAKNLAMKTVPVIVDDFSDPEFDRVRLLENLARKDLTDYEMARVLDYMLKTYSKVYPTQQALADEIGKTQAWVSFHLRVLELEKDTNITRVIKPEKLTERQARAILEAPEEKRSEVAKHIADHIAEEGIPPSAREIKSFVHPETESGPPATPSTLSPPQPIEREPTKSNPKPEEIDVGEFLCPECDEKYLLVHVAAGNHRLRRVHQN